MKTPFLIALYLKSANPHEVTLVENTVHEIVTIRTLMYLIGDGVYDRDSLDVELLQQQDIEIIAPHKNTLVPKPNIVEN